MPKKKREKSFFFNSFGIYQEESSRWDRKWLSAALWCKVGPRPLGDCAGFTGETDKNLIFDATLVFNAVSSRVDKRWMDE